MINRMRLDVSQTLSFSVTPFDFDIVDLCNELAEQMEIIQDVFDH